MSIFKYMSEDRIENVLIDNKIRFTQPIYFNDPFEVKLSINGLALKSDLIKQHNEVFEETIKNLYNKEFSHLRNLISFKQFISLIDEKEILKQYLAVTNNEIFHQNIMKTFNEVISNKVGILSLTTKNDNLLMWAHYANEHKGFVIEFDRKNDFLNGDLNNQIYNGLQKVNYSKERPNKFLIETEWHEVLLTKSEEWSYEKEFRIIKQLEDADNKKGNIHLFKFPKKMIKSIYCGCNMIDSNIERILNIVKNDSELEHVEVYKSKVSDKFYCLEFIKIK